MQVHYFSPYTGAYYFQTDRLTADQHSHPATEIVWSRDQAFRINLGDGWRSTRTAVIPPNEPHALQFEGTGTLELLLIEQPGRDMNAVITTILEHLHLPSVELATTLPDLCTRGPAPWLPQWDERVGTCIATMQEQLTYAALLRTVSARCHLSASRTSRLFRNAMGLPLRDYYQWVRLKQALTDYLGRDRKFASAGVAAGFYDQPHFNRVYRRFMGQAPSQQYNSGIVQGSQGA